MEIQQSMDDEIIYHQISPALPWIMKFFMTLWKVEPLYPLFPGSLLSARAIKFATVYGAVLFMRPKTILPEYSFPMWMSKKTLTSTIAPP